MSADKHYEELDKLVSRLLDQEITDSELLRLHSLLERSRSNRLRYLRFVQLDSLLLWDSELFTEAHPAAEKPDHKTVFPLFASFWNWTGALAAALVAMAGAWWGFSRNGDEAVVNGSLQPEGQAELAALPNLHPSSSSLDEELLENSFSPDFNSDSILPLPRQQAALDARFGLEVLLSNNRFASGGVFEYLGPVRRWNRVPQLVRPAENGILPATGSKMMAMKPMAIDVEAQVAHSIETVQVLDVRDAMRLHPRDKAYLSASIKFNQSYGSLEHGAEFGISLHAFRESGEGFEATSLCSDDNLLADNDPSSWEKLSSRLELPADAEFVVVSLVARKVGPEALIANASSYYSDDLELSMFVGDRSILGPI